MPTVAVIPLTRSDTKRRKTHPFEYDLAPDAVQKGVSHRVVPTQLRTVDKVRFDRTRVGMISDLDTTYEIENRISEYLGIEFD